MLRCPKGDEDNGITREFSPDIGPPRTPLKVLVSHSSLSRSVRYSPEYQCGLTCGMSRAPLSPIPSASPLYKRPVFRLAACTDTKDCMSTIVFAGYG